MPQWKADIAGLTAKTVRLTLWHHLTGAKYTLACEPKRRRSWDSRPSPISLPMQTRWTADFMASSRGNDGNRSDQSMMTDNAF